MIRFLADADLDFAIVSGCRRREPAIDFLSANDANLEGVPDPTVLGLTGEQNRILVSHDFPTMPRHFGEFLQERASSPGGRHPERGQRAAAEKRQEHDPVRTFATSRPDDKRTPLRGWGPEI